MHQLNYWSDATTIQSRRKGLQWFEWQNSIIVYIKLDSGTHSVPLISPLSFFAGKSVTIRSGMRSLVCTFVCLFHVQISPDSSCVSSNRDNSHYRLRFRKRLLFSLAYPSAQSSNNDDCAKFYAFDGSEQAALCGSDGQNARSDEQKTEVDPQYA